ncbi:hypothetical protein HanIR_Chr12g0614671 [Helianthus annuus]|nr:hypothetical protein HanIR_Chr12g0614671 [Helianthus annuus]
METQTLLINVLNTFITVVGVWFFFKSNEEDDDYKEFFINKVSPKKSYVVTVVIHPKGAGPGPGPYTFATIFFTNIYGSYQSVSTIYYSILNFNLFCFFLM